MCVPILRSISTKLTNLENMQISYVLFDVTSWGLDTSDRYFDQEYFEVSTISGSKVMAQTVVFVFLVTLTLTYVLFFVTRTGHDVLESPCKVSYKSVQY